MTDMHEKVAIIVYMAQVSLSRRLRETKFIEA